MAWLPARALRACASPSLVMAMPLEMALPPARALRACASSFLVMAKPLETAMPPAFSFRASDVLVPGPGQTPKADRRELETLSHSLLNFSEQPQRRETGAELKALRPPLGFKLRGIQLLVLLLFLLGMGHESPLQQQESPEPFLSLQQACAFLPLLFFLQHDIAPLLQQFSMSQHASVF